MSNTTVERPPMNGVDVPALFATINHVGEMPELAKFEFRAMSQWVDGTHSRTTIESFFGAGDEQSHDRPMMIDADHPKVLTGGDRGATPVEILLTALASCLMAGIANIAAARGVTLERVTASVRGQIDLRGLLGLSDEVRNGFQKITVDFDIEGDASPEKLAEIVAQSRRRSAVFDIITNGVPVEINVD